MDNTENIKLPGTTLENALSPTPQFSPTPKATPTIVNVTTTGGSVDAADFIETISRQFGNGSGTYTLEDVREIAKMYHMSKGTSTSYFSKRPCLIITLFIILMAAAVLGSTYLAEWAIEDNDDSSMPMIHASAPTQPLSIGPVLKSSEGSEVSVKLTRAHLLDRMSDILDIPAQTIAQMTAVQFYATHADFALPVAISLRVSGFVRMSDHEAAVFLSSGQLSIIRDPHVGKTDIEYTDTLGRQLRVFDTDKDLEALENHGSLHFECPPVLIPTVLLPNMRQTANVPMAKRATLLLDAMGDDHWKNLRTEPWAPDFTYSSGLTSTDAKRTMVNRICCRNLVRQVGLKSAKSSAMQTLTVSVSS